MLEKNVTLKQVAGVGLLLLSGCVAFPEESVIVYDTTCPIPRSESESVSSPEDLVPQEPSE